MLVPIIEWAIHRLDPEVEILEPEFRKRRGSVPDFLCTHESDAMLIFVHRDSENRPLEHRLREFDGVAGSDVVPVVPVRMSEAWVLFDGAAIARAAGFPAVEVSVPKISDIESISDPKGQLDQLLFRAAGSPTGRHGRNFNRSIVQRRISVAACIADYGPLEDLPAFRRFQSALAERYPYGNRVGQ